MAKVKKAEKAKVEQVNSKDALATANKALTTFLKTNKLARDEDHSKNKKFGKEFKELTLAVEKASASMDEGNAKAEKAVKKEKKETSGKAGRVTQYDYPEGLTAAEKKEFRVKARRAAKAGDKPEKAEKAPKAEKAKGGKKEVEEVKTKKVKTKEAEPVADKKKKKKAKKNND